MTVSINGTTGISGVDGSAATPALQGSDTNTGISFGTDEVAINTGGTARVTVNSSGNVGIANTSPTQRLDVTGNVKLSGIVVLNNDQAVQWGSSNTARITGQDAAGGGVMSFITSGTERARITSGGDFLSNTTDINPVANNVSGVAIRLSGNILTNVQSVNAPHQFRRNTDGDLIRFHNNSTTDCGAVRVAGQQTFFDSTSDYRLKENVVSLNNAIARVMQLAPKQFNFIGDPANTFDGFLAHEVQAVVPMCASGEKDAVDEDGNPEYQGIDQSKLVPLLTAALQEAITRIETLEAEVQALKGGN